MVKNMNLKNTELLCRHLKVKCLNNVIFKLRCIADGIITFKANVKDLIIELNIITKDNIVTTDETIENILSYKDVKYIGYRIFTSDEDFLFSMDTNKGLIVNKYIGSGEDSNKTFGDKYKTLSTLTRQIYFAHHKGLDFFMKQETKESIQYAKWVVGNHITEFV